MNKAANNITEHFNELPNYKLSPEKDAEILKTLRNRELEREFLTESSPKLNLLTLFNMLSKRLVSVLATIAVVASGLFYYTATTSYAYHLNKAQKAMVELEMVVEGRAQHSALIPAAYADDGEIDTEAASELTIEVVFETALSIELAEEIKNPVRLKKALSEIKALQEEEVKVFAKAVAAIQSGGARTEAEAALMATNDDKKEVESALIEVDQAIQNNSEVTVDIETQIDIEAKAHFEAAARAIESLTASGEVNAKVMESLEAKLSKASIALESGKLGRVKGLTNAIQVKVASEINKEGRSNQDDDPEDSEEEEQEQEDKKEKSREEKNKDKDKDKGMEVNTNLEVEVNVIDPDAEVQSSSEVKGGLDSLDIEISGSAKAEVGAQSEQ